LIELNSPTEAMAEKKCLALFWCLLLSSLLTRTVEAKLNLFLNQREVRRLLGAFDSFNFVFDSILGVASWADYSGKAANYWLSSLIVLLRACSSGHRRCRPRGLE
jgi:hypothetical protein